MARWVIFTDLDGTLLDRKTYDWSAAAGAIEQLKRCHVPIVFCSSKTWKEQSYYQAKLGLKEPCIVENGSAIILPAESFRSEDLPNHRQVDDHLMIELGDTAARIQSKLDEIQMKLGLCFRRFATMTDEQVAKLTGLTTEQATRARARDYSETIDANFAPQEWSDFQDALFQEELTCVSGGHLHTVTSRANSKGRAIEILRQLLRKRDGEFTSVGLGDSSNDRSMLEKMDIAFQVQRPDKTWHDLKLPNVIRVGVGPLGWSEAVTRVLADPPR